MKLSDFDQDLGVWDFLGEKNEEKKEEKKKEKWFLGGDLGLTHLEYLGRISEGFFFPLFFGSWKNKGIKQILKLTKEKSKINREKSRINREQNSHHP